MRLRRLSVVVGGSTSSPTCCPFALTAMEDVSYLPSRPHLRKCTCSLSTNQGPLRIFPRERQYVCMPTACSLHVISDMKHSCTHICDVYTTYTHTHSMHSQKRFLRPRDKAGRAPTFSHAGSLTDDHLGKEAVEWEGELAQKKLQQGREASKTGGPTHGTVRPGLRQHRSLGLMSPLTAPKPWASGGGQAGELFECL